MRSWCWYYWYPVLPTLSAPLHADSVDRHPGPPQLLPVQGHPPLLRQLQVSAHPDLCCRIHKGMLRCKQLTGICFNGILHGCTAPVSGSKECHAPPWCACSTPRSVPRYPRCTGGAPTLPTWCMAASAQCVCSRALLCVQVQLCVHHLPRLIILHFHFLWDGRPTAPIFA